MKYEGYGFILPIKYDANLNRVKAFIVGSHLLCIRHARPALLDKQSPADSCKAEQAGLCFVLRYFTTTIGRRFVNEK
jgi:hypothetical protein